MTSPTIKKLNKRNYPRKGKKNRNEDSGEWGRKEKLKARNKEKLKGKKRKKSDKKYLEKEEKGRLKTSTTKINKMKWNRKVKQRLKNIIK